MNSSTYYISNEKKKKKKTKLFFPLLCNCKILGKLTSVFKSHKNMQTFQSSSLESSSFNSGILIPKYTIFNSYKK